MSFLRLVHFWCYWLFICSSDKKTSVSASTEDVNTLVYLKKLINVACLTHLLYLVCYPATLFLKPSLHSSYFLIISC